MGIIPDLTNDEPTGDISGIDADALLNEIEGGGNTEIPMEGGEQAPDQAPAPAAAPEPESFEFTWNGRPIKATREQVLQWSSQGYDYSQRMAQLKQEQQAREQEWQQKEQAISPYKTIDEYAKQNPDWWSHVESLYQARMQGGAEGGAANLDAEQLKAKILKDLSPKLNELQQFKQSIEQERQAQQQKQEDDALIEEIKSIREAHPDPAWETPDERGQTLEQKVLEHAVNNRINSFRAAFRDYYHDKLVAKASEQAKEQTNKDLQKRTKAGLLGQSSTPRKGVATAESVKSKSYEDLMREGLEEFGIA